MASCCPRDKIGQVKQIIKIARSRDIRGIITIVNQVALAVGDYRIAVYFKTIDML